MVSDRDERFVLDGPVRYTNHRFGGNLHFFHTGVTHGITVQDSELPGELLTHPDGMWVGGAVNLRHSTLDTVSASGIETVYDFYAFDADISADIDVSGADIGRDLVLEAARCGMVDATGSTVGRYLNGRETTVEGRLNVAGGAVGWDVDLTGATVGGDIDLAGAAIEHVLYLDETELGGVVDLSGAKLHGIYADELGAYEFRFDERTVIDHVYTDVVDRYGQTRVVPMEHQDVYR